MVGARSPACAATLTNFAWKGRPDGFPRGAGVTPRDAIPLYCCAFTKPEWSNPRADAERTCRRVIALFVRISDPILDRISSEMGRSEMGRAARLPFVLAAVFGLAAQHP